MYFDENKVSSENQYFCIGGIIVPESEVLQLEKTLSQIQYNFFGTATLRKDTEFHGKDMFHGKGNFRRRKLPERVQLFKDISLTLINHKIPIRVVIVDVEAHKRKYTFPTPEYRLGLMLILERFCDYLDKVDDLGIVYGDYEKDEVTGSVLDFSDFKFSGTTPMNLGREIDRLVDTIYFTHSHHSRFLQVADVVMYLAGRCENTEVNDVKNWHSEQAMEIWENLKASIDFKIQRWP